MKNKNIKNNQQGHHDGKSLVNQTVKIVEDKRNRIKLLLQFIRDCKP